MRVWSDDGALQLQFDGDGDHLSYLVVDNELMYAAAERLRACGPNVRVHYESEVLAGDESAGRGGVTLRSGDQYPGDLIVACDGARSAVRSERCANDVSVSGFAYNESAVCFTIQFDEDVAGEQRIAYQVFLGGRRPLALLPLETANQFSVVWTVDRRWARELTSPDAREELAAAVCRHSGVASCARVVTPVVAIPLDCHLSAPFSSQRQHIVLLGDAAHRIHPFAGQGLNIAFRQAAELVACIGECVEAGMAPSMAIRTYERSHMRAEASVVGLNALYQALRAVPSLATAAARIPQLRRLFVQAAA